MNPKELIEKSLIRAKAELNVARKLYIQDRLNIYNDNWKGILKAAVDEQFSEKTRENIKQMLDDSVNVLKRIVKEISGVYAGETARRALRQDNTEDENYKNIISAIPANIICQEVNRLTNLCNESFVYIVPRNKRIEYDILTPDLVEVIQNEDDPTKIDAITIIQTFVDTVGKTKIYYIYWDVYGNHLKFDENLMPVKIPNNEAGVNPYKDPNDPSKTILPFVLFHKDWPLSSIWNTTSGNDLVSANKQIGVLATYLNYLMKVGSFKMLTFTGVDIKDIPQEIVFDPLYPKAVKSPDGQIGTVDLQINMDQIWTIIINKIGVIANNYGLSLDNFKVNISAQSGFALRLKNFALEKVVNEQRKVYRIYENELFDKTRIINNYFYKTKKIDEKAKFIVDYEETEYPSSPEEIRMQWKFDIQLGARSILDYIRYINPDLKSDEEAKEYLEKNVEINNEIRDEFGVSVDKLLEAAFQEQPLMK